MQSSLENIMIKAETLNLITYGWMAVAVATSITMFFITAPYGRHTSEKWGLMISNKAGWIIMEMPSLLIMLCFLLFGTKSFNSFVWILFSLWIFHYINRTLIYPFRIKSTGKKMPLVIALSAIFFNTINAGLNGYYLSEIAPSDNYSSQWFFSAHFMIGVILFIAGISINWKSDTMLINLRKPSETGYKIPQGFLFDYITSPNLFGEIIEWTGFAIMAWNLPALSFLVWVFANLIPRAINHHDWYHRKFPDYPIDRKIIIPFIF
jgi:3-oxo-5-alpha-steroid 4-dehydrogenase 1